MTEGGERHLREVLEGVPRQPVTDLCCFHNKVCRTVLPLPLGLCHSLVGNFWFCESVLNPWGVFELGPDTPDFLFFLPSLQFQVGELSCHSQPLAGAVLSPKH